MNVSERNKKIALARWSKKHSEDLKKINTNTEALILKASICGFLAGDGSVQKRKEKQFYHYQLDFFPDDELMMNTYIDQMKTVYAKTPKIKKNNNFYSVRITSKVIVEDLLKEAKFGIKNWTLPENLISLKGGKEAWLRGFFSAEAYVNKRSIKIQTINEKGMLQIVKMLNNLGIETKHYDYQPKKENHSTVHMIFI
ncbi:MAG: LAGLIDADG family homing endonuclease, partial [Nanoarchaeota archaeon]